jgi:hypothetical protein
MNEQETKQLIKSAINGFDEKNLTDQSIHLFNTLGYNTKRRNPFTNKSFQEFQDNFGDFFAEKKFNAAKALTKDWKYIDLLFQLTKNEVSDQENLFNTGKVKWEGEDKETVIETYLFFVVELINSDYSRSQLAQITREINKIFPMPAMLLFKYGDHLTLSIINRRLHKKDTQKDVLEKVTLIKDVSIKNPHRAHLEILFDLSFDELKRNYKFTNFVELHNAWQDTLDIKELNKKFYRELSNWYFWAINKVSFPNDVTDDTDDTKYNSESVIRLITRLIFIWFIKEKNLIPEKIFDKKELPKIIKGFREKGSKVYYRAILQNLFFATLNQKIEDRKFANDGGYLKHRVDYGIKNLYRYTDDFLISKEEVIELFKNVPFLNGGLFDCLDRENHDNKVIYLDGFSRNPKKQAQVPDELFFSQEKSIDLSDVYSDKRKKNEKVKGLFNIFSHYKFTVAENTPIEEEVALDPELLGRVFENLLASYNPETKTTARKQTGSFYTPREIVNYMVDESLKAYLKQKLETEASMSSEEAEYGLEILLGYNEKDHLFNQKETHILVKAIDNCKIIDPACGSGAFPMGILHKLVFILQKLDPQNDIWRKIQLENAIKETEDTYKIGDKQEREERLIEINNTFDENVNNPDYARKLFLIENCIYGVDIQPIAIQISKLRFFISLVVDQKTDKNKDNLGIIQLPNLETKFVTANTLIGIDKPKVGEFVGSIFDNIKVKELEEKIKEIRHKLFRVKTAVKKRKLREDDQKLREEMSKILKNSGWSNKSARQLAKWDPYDQNASSDFFDPEWMFGIKDGFDIVIANPPYIQIKQISSNEKYYFINHYQFAKGRFNLFYLFIEITKKLNSKDGIAIYIVPDRLLLNTQCYDLRCWLLHQQTIIEIDSFDESLFESAVVDSIILIYKNSISDQYEILSKSNVSISELNNPNKIRIPTSYFINSPNKQFNLDYTFNKANLIEKIRLHSRPLGEISETKDGIIQSKIPDILFLNKKENDSCRKLLFGRDISRYYLKYNNRWVNYQPNKMMKIELERGGGGLRLRKKDIFEKVKILTRQTADEIIGTVDYENYYYTNTIHGTIITDNKYNIKFILVLLNSKLLNYYYKATTSEGKKVFAQIKIDILRKLPIKFSHSQNTYVNFVNYLLFLNSQNNHRINKALFENILDAMVYDLYFPEEIKNINAEVMKYLTNIPELQEEWDKDRKLQVIEDIYMKLSNPNHPVSIAMERQKTIPEIRIIEGLPEKT